MQPAQLDIFADSRDTMLRNDVLGALEGRDAAGAQHALLALRGEYAGDVWLESLQRLADHVGREPGGRFQEHTELQHACADLSQGVEPAARLVFRAEAERWMTPSWAELAQRTTNISRSAWWFVRGLYENAMSERLRVFRFLAPSPSGRGLG